MANFYTIVQTGEGESAPCPVNYRSVNFQIGFGCTVSGTATYTVQHTFDDVYAEDYDPDTGTWFDHSYVVDQTGNMDGNYAFPVSAIRLEITAGSGSVTMTALQGFGRN